MDFWWTWDRCWINVCALVFWKITLINLNKWTESASNIFQRFLFYRFGEPSGHGWNVQGRVGLFRRLPETWNTWSIFQLKREGQFCHTFPRMVEQTGSSFRISIFGKALEASNTCNLLGICIVRAIPRPSKHGSTFCQKSHQNPGLGAPKSMSGGVWGRLGSVLSHLGPSWTFLEASWSALEASWRRLGNLLGRFGPKKLAEMAPSWLRKRYQNL